MFMFVLLLINLHGTAELPFANPRSNLAVLIKCSPNFCLIPACAEASTAMRSSNFYQVFQKALFDLFAVSEKGVKYVCFC
jgi:hypothetical protein